MDTLDRLDANYELNLDTNQMEHGPDVNIPLLLTACLGLAAESGEFIEIPKKIFFQGKALSHDNLFHMKRELGDICWYLAQAFMALDTNFEEILQMNFEKLSARYPEGTFDVWRSENRVEGDL